MQAQGVVQYNADNRAFEGATNTNITVQVVCDMVVGAPDALSGYVAVSNLLNNAAPNPNQVGLRVGVCLRALGLAAEHLHPRSPLNVHSLLTAMVVVPGVRWAPAYRPAPLHVRVGRTDARISGGGGVCMWAPVH